MRAEPAGRPPGVPPPGPKAGPGGPAGGDNGARAGSAHLPALARRAWDPAPVPEPDAEPGLAGRSWPERSAEVTRIALLRGERWLSPGGVLREWVRLNVWAAVFLSAAALLVVPPATALLDGAVGWSALAAAGVSNVTGAFADIHPAVAGLATLLALAFLVRRHTRRRRYGRDPHHYPYD